MKYNRNNTTEVDYDSITDTFKGLTKEGTGDIYLNEKWISFRNDKARRKMNTKDNKYTQSQCAGGAAKYFRDSGKTVGVFLVHHRVYKDPKKDPEQEEYKPPHHANVLVFDSTKREVHYYNPYIIQMTTLPRLVSAMVDELRGVKVIKCITGPQRRGTITCIKHSFQFTKEYLKNPDILNTYHYYKISTKTRRCPFKRLKKK